MIYRKPIFVSRYYMTNNQERKIKYQRSGIGIKYELSQLELMTFLCENP